MRNKAWSLWQNSKEKKTNKKSENDGHQPQKSANQPNQAIKPTNQQKTKNTTLDR